MEQLGYSFEEGASLVRDLSMGLKTGLKIPPDVLKTGKELTAVLGLTGDEAGNLIVQFQKSGLSVKELNESFTAGADEARKYGVPVNDVLRDIASAPDLLARFGAKNAKEFARSAAKAKSYGLSIKDLNSAFGKQMDTFEGSSDAATKLNAVFGTSINSLELMLETNPEKRMEMMRKSIENQGKSWEKMDVFQRNALTSATGLTDAQAQLAFSSKKERDALEKKAKAREREIKVDEKWNSGMSSIKRTLSSWGPLLDNLMRSASDFIVKLFGGKDAATTAKTTAKAGEDAIRTITKAIDDSVGKIQHYKDIWDNLFTSERGVDVESAENLIKMIEKNDIRDLEKIKELLDGKDAKAVEQIALRRLRLGGKGSQEAIELLEKAKITTEALGEASKEFTDMSSGDLFSPETQKKLKDLHETQDSIKNAQFTTFGEDDGDMAPDALPSLAPLKRQTFKDAYIHKSGKTIGIAEDDSILVRKNMEKVNNGTKSSSQSDNKELIQTVNALQMAVDKLSRTIGEEQKIVLSSVDGSFIGRGLVKKARGSI